MQCLCVPTSMRIEGQYFLHSLFVPFTGFYRILTYVGAAALAAVAGLAAGAISWIATEFAAPSSQYGFYC